MLVGPSCGGGYEEREREGDGKRKKEGGSERKRANGENKRDEE